MTNGRISDKVPGVSSEAFSRVSWQFVHDGYIDGFESVRGS